ncbi:flagellin N-terminal helical domain-containing protein [Paracoccus beibuensis]|uniref:flagellin N-terminal helical domain-containing protein n=1 Tax=Paracoccus beibuensis TaxID=547602 RepID=UPI002240499A|nr:flagellin [Paracoccus beibuensis]
MTSILTNNSAMVALQTLKNINSQLGKTQADIATGKTVSNAKDNAAVWAISKVMETDQSGFKTIQSNLNVADSVVGTARKGAEEVVKLLTEMKNLAIGAGNDAADFGKIQTDIDGKMAQINSVIGASQMNGINLLKTDVNGAGAAEFTVLGSLDRTNGTVATASSDIVVTGVDFEAQIGGAAPAAITDQASALTAIGEIEALLDIAVQGAADLGSSGKRISDQSSFVGALADSLKSGVGSLVDADMEEASARLQALQTQQQLGIQALSIANQAPGAVMSLFR